MNFVFIAGHLGADPEVRFTTSGQKVTTLRVAARVRRGGNDETIWWKVTCWGDQFDRMISFFKKGSSIMVVGDLNKPEIYTNKEGQPQISMSLTAVNLMFSPFGKPNEKEQDKLNNEEGKAEAFASFASGQHSKGQGSEEEVEDEIPF